MQDLINEVGDIAAALSMRVISPREVRVEDVLVPIHVGIFEFAKEPELRVFLGKQLEEILPRTRFIYDGTSAYSGGVGELVPGIRYIFLGGLLGDNLSGPDSVNTAIKRTLDLNGESAREQIFLADRVVLPRSRLDFVAFANSRRR